MNSTDGLSIPRTTAGEGPGLLLIHGWNASRRFFDPILPYLAGRFRILAPDLLGCGDAPKPSRNHTLSDYAQWCLRAADQAGLRRTALLGHSMGAAIGILVASRHPDRIEALLLANGLVQGRTALKRIHRPLVRFPLRQVMLGLRRVRAVRRLLSSDFSAIERIHPAAARDMLRGTYRMLSTSLDSLLEADLEGPLRELEVPVGILWSRNDPQLSEEQLHVQRRARPEAPVHIFPRGGHCPMIEAPREFAQAVVQILDRLRHDRP